MAHFAISPRLPDAIHLAVARRVGMVLVYTDVVQVRAAHALGIAATDPLQPDETAP